MMFCKFFRYLGPVIGAAMIYFFWPKSYDVAYRPLVMLAPIFGGLILPMLISRSCKKSI